MKVILFGATGMVGQGVLRECLRDDGIEGVLAVGRSSTGQTHPKLRELIRTDLFDFGAAGPDLRGYDACFFCLGVSSAGMNEADYTHLTFDLTLGWAHTLAEINPLLITKEYVKPAELTWSDETYRGDAYGAYGWGCDVAEVERNPDTFEVRPTRVTAVAEIGKAIHPVLAAGQIEGGTAQGIGYALLEEVVMRDGRMANAQLTNYTIPTTLDTPEIDTVILENAYAHGPFGAKGVGEMPIDGPAPAIVNAIRHMGIDMREIPATPERIMAAGKIS